jgi:hypothetical protein
MTTRTWWSSAIAVTALTAGLCGCTGAGGDAAAPAPDPTSEVTSAAATEPGLPDVLQGTWLIRLSREELRDDLAAAGFGMYADRFFQVEQLTDPATLLLTFAPTTFQITFLERDGAWKAGWWGSATAEDGLLTLHDDYYDLDDVFRWRIRDDHLSLRFRSTTGELIDGIPSEAYSRAYFSRPIPAVECEPADPEACLKSADG